MRALIALALLTLTACELTRSPTAIQLTEDRVMVQSVLVAGDTMARVLIRLIRAETDPALPGVIDDTEPVADAAVHIIAGADTVELRARTDLEMNPCVSGGAYPQTPAGELLPGCYFGNLPAPVAAGAKYGLLIDLPERGRVTGMTMVPHPLRVVSPDSGTHVTNGAARVPAPVHVSWTAPAHAQRVELAAEAEGECAAYVAVSSLAYTISLDVSGDSETAARFMLSCAPPPQHDLRGAILIMVYDTAYSRYVRAVENNHRPEDASAGLNGPVIGAFGSVATARRPVLFVPD